MHSAYDGCIREQRCSRRNRTGFRSDNKLAAMIPNDHRFIDGSTIPTIDRWKASHQTISSNHVTQKIQFGAHLPQDFTFSILDIGVYPVFFPELGDVIKVALVFSELILFVRRLGISSIIELALSPLGVHQTLRPLCILLSLWKFSFFLLVNKKPACLSA